MWALPRMEEVPVLTCSLHPKKEIDEEDIARALTPTKSIPMGSGTASESLVLPGNKQIVTRSNLELSYYFTMRSFEYKSKI